MKLFLAGRCQRTERPAMKGIQRSNDLITIRAAVIRRIFPGELDRRLIRLSPRIAEKDLVAKELTQSSLASLICGSIWYRFDT
jgi:hypothetical protein